jgi:hypothetical protein
VNRESAYEILSRRAAPAESPEPQPGAARPASRRPAAEPAETPPTSESGGGFSELLWGTKRRQGLVEALAKQTARTVGSEVGRQILRGVLGGILGGSSRRAR